MEVLDAFADQILITPDELAARWASIERELAVFALAVAHVDAGGRWGDDGSVTMRAWMRQHLRMSDTDAGALLRRAGLLDRYSAFADCAVTGALSGSQLRELERCDRPKYRQLLGRLQEDLVADVADLDARDTAGACEVWRQRAEAIIDEDAPPVEPQRTLNTSVAGDGHLVGRFTLDPAGRVEFDTAVANAITWSGADETRTAEQRRGDALFDIVAFYNLNHRGTGTPRHRPHVSMSLEASTLGAPVATGDADGRLIDAACADAKLCDCVIHSILRDATGAPLAFGRARYTVPRRLFEQVAARDGGCRFPGCDRPVRFTEAHHMHHWEHGGSTDFENLALLCTRHHHLVHAQHLRLDWGDGWDLHITWPNGINRTSRPRGAPPGRQPRAA